MRMAAKQARVVLALVMALMGTAALTPAPAGAAWDDYHWSAAFGGYVDRFCTGSETMNVIVYANRDYSGARTRICSTEPDLGQVYLVTQQSYQPPSTFVGTAAQDRISSYKVIKVPSCRQMGFYWNNDYVVPERKSGVGNTAYVGDTWNDNISSIKLAAPFC